MRKGSLILATLAVLAVECKPQVLAPAEILDPAMRALQQQHFADMKAAAVEITSHSYPFRFYLSRTLDVTEKREQLTDQRSIRFSNFQGRTVLQVTGNYFASYSNETVTRNERVKRTYLDVVLPILRAATPRLANEPKLSAFAIEVSHHVRKQVLGVTVENIENLAVIVPRAVAQRMSDSNNENEQVTALLESRVFVDGNPVTLWPSQGAVAAENVVAAESTEAPVVEAAPLPTAKIVPARAAILAEPVPAPAAPVRNVSPEALRQQQASYQGLIDRVLQSMEGQAHFVSYAPPVLIAFHGMSYLQLSITTDLAARDTGSQYQLAALAFDRHVSHLIRPLLTILPKEVDFDGVVFSSTVRTAPKESEHGASVEFFLPLAELRRFENYDLTGQQLINSGFVLINGERVGLDLQSAEAGPR